MAVVNTLSKSLWITSRNLPDPLLGHIMKFVGKMDEVRHQSTWFFRRELLRGHTWEYYYGFDFDSQIEEPSEWREVSAVNIDRLRSGMLMNIPFTLPGYYQSAGVRYRVTGWTRIPLRDGTHDKVMVLEHHQMRWDNIYVRCSPTNTIPLSIRVMTVPGPSTSVFTDLLKFDVMTDDNGMKKQVTSYMKNPDRFIGGAQVKRDVLTAMMRQGMMRATQRVFVRNTHNNLIITSNHVVFNPRWKSKRVRMFQKQSLLMHSLKYHFKQQVRSVRDRYQL